MTQKMINLGSLPNDGTGDPLRSAFTKINENFTEVYTAIAALTAVPPPPPSPTYAISSNLNTVNEGATITFNVVTTNVADGTILYWTNSGTTVAEDFADTVNSGSVTVSSNSATFTRILTEDALTEGSQTVIMQLRTGSISGPVVATANEVVVSDTSLTPPPPPPPIPTYSVAPNVTTINEGGVVTFNITTSNVADGTVLYWENTGTTTSEDFSDSLNSGSVVVTTNTASVSKTLNEDSTTEGDQTIVIELRVDNVTGPVVATSELVNVIDSSVTPAPPAPTYSIVPRVTSVNEGGVVVYDITTTNVDNGTVLYWTNTGNTVAEDFAGTSTTGSVVINSNVATLAITTVEDQLTEGDQFITIQLRTDSITGTIIATAATVTVVDTSLTPPPPPSPVVDGDESVTAKYNTAISGNLFANLTVQPGLTYTITQFQINGVSYQPGDAIISTVGLITINADGTWTFTPEAGYTGPVPAVTYTITNGQMYDTSTLTIGNVPPPVPVIDQNEVVQGLYETDIGGDLLSNTTKVPGKTYTVDNFTVNGVTTLTSGTYTIPNVGWIFVHVDGGWLFTPDAGYFGSVPVITYTVSDGDTTDTSTLTILDIVVPTPNLPGNPAPANYRFGFTLSSVSMPQVIDTVDSSMHSTVKYMIESTDGAGKYDYSEVVIAHVNGTVVVKTLVDSRILVGTDGLPLVTVSGQVADGYVNVFASSAVSGVSLKVLRTLL